MTTGVFEKGWHPISSIPSSLDYASGERGSDRTQRTHRFLLHASAKAVNAMEKVFASAGVSVIPATLWRSREQAQRKISGFQKVGKLGCFRVGWSQCNTSDTVEIS
jgi:hypothetical protein